MDNYKIVSLNTGESIEFDNTVFVLHRADFGAVSALHKSYESSGTGLHHTYAALGKRDVKLEGYILPQGNTVKEKEEFSSSARRLISRITNPLYDFEIVKNSLHLTCSAESGVRFSAEAHLFSPDAVFFEINATAFFPCFTEKIEAARHITYTDAAYFPLSIGRGFYFGNRAPAQALAVYNKGDIDSGCIIEFEAQKQIPSLSLENTATGESININYTLRSGEILKIDTRAGKKSAAADYRGDIKDIMKFVDYKSTFFSLVPGENVIVWKSGTNKCDARVSVSVTPAYLSL